MTRSNERFAAAFTLVELMISLALMVLMMLGVNYIFSSVGKATGAAQIVSRFGHDSQAAQNVFIQDFGNITLKDAPFLLISSQIQPAFSSKTDELGAIDPNN